MQRYSELTRNLLKKRGITNTEEADVFFNPDYERDLHDPFLMKDMERACVRLYEAIDNDEKVVIYADYDCDGIPGAVILQDLLKKVGYKNYEVYIPERNSEGYGLNMTALDELRDKGVKLVITIDLGITAVAEVAQAIVYGMDVIITDHHLPKADLPRAYAILNPKVDGYPGEMLARRSLGEGGLCGAGVIFKFVQGFIKKYGELYKIKNGAEKWMLDMAGIATLSDMVPLTGENRAISYFGMKVLRKSPRPGLQKLLAKLKIDQKYLAEDDVGFMIAPRLNAASRMDSPMRAFELLSTDDVAEAGVLVDHLTKINDERKRIVISIMKDVHKQFEIRKTEESMKSVIVVGNPGWKVGVLGLVAGKICDEYGSPVFVWGKDENDVIKGSCRSNGSVSLVELMTETKEHFLEFGGHEQAGGFSVDAEKIHFLEEALSLSFLRITTPSVPSLKRQGDTDLILDEERAGGGDFKLSLSDVNMTTWRELDKFTPFGLGNPKPVFLFEGVKIESIKKFGKGGSGEHLEITFSGNTDTRMHEVKAIAFFSGLDSFKTPIAEGLPVNLLATFDLSRFRGRPELRLRVVDII